MYKKAIVIELKDCYALAMEEGGGIIRIKKKPGLSVGDSIYVLPEDLYQKETKASVVSFGAAGASQKRKNSSNIHTGLWMKVASAAAVVLLCIGIMAPQMRVKAYALTSFDGDISIQLELDDQYRIIRIFSPDKGAEEKLKALRGKHIREAGEELKALCGDGQILAGYAVLDERKKDAGLEEAPLKEDHSDFQEEIYQFQKELSLFALTLEDLAENSPRHQDTRERAVTIAEKSSREQVIVDETYRKRKLPIRRVAKFCSVSEKIVKDSKLFILATMLIFLKKFPMLLNWVGKGRKLYV